MTPKPWGLYEVLDVQPGLWVKKLIVLPRKRLSLQKHYYRREHWVCVHGEGIATIKDWPKTLKNGDRHIMVPGSTVYVPEGTLHRLENDGEHNLVVIEVATGSRLSEDDIIRVEDDYGRETREDDLE